MNFITPLAPAYPEIFLLVMVCVILVADLFVSDDNRVATYALTQIALAGTFAITLLTARLEPETTFSGMFVDDLMSDVLKLLVYAAVMVMLVYSRAYIGTRSLFRGEFFVLALFATLGMMVMISANHLLTLYLGLELMSLALYAMVALQRDSAVATEAAMKYFVLGALAEAIFSGGSRGIVLVFALVFIVAGLGFKLGAVPFHMWVPDVYHGAPTAVTLFIGSAPKLAAFGFIMRLLAQGLGAEPLVEAWQQMLVVMSVASLVIGNVTAIAQTNLKRMLAYSTIGHMGFLLLGILAGNLIGYGAGMFYVVVYVLMSLGAFGMILLLSRAGFEAENLEDFKGLNQRSPWYAFIMLLLMFSMAGVPPTVGFYAKLVVLQAVINVDYVWLAVVAVVFSLVGAFYYLRIVKLMYFDEPKETHAVRASRGFRVALSANGLALLVFGLLPQPLMALCYVAISRL